MKNINKLTCASCFLLFIFGCQPDPYKQGRIIYAYHCENCHMEDGSGLEALIPSLAQSEMLKDPQKLVCLIRTGIPLNFHTRQEMPPNKSLNEVELTNLLNYLGNRYSSKNKVVKVSDVHNWLTSCL